MCVPHANQTIRGWNPRTGSSSESMIECTTQCTAACRGERSPNGPHDSSTRATLATSPEAAGAPAGKALRQLRPSLLVAARPSVPGLPDVPDPSRASGGRGPPGRPAVCHGGQKTCHQSCGDIAAAGATERADGHVCLSDPGRGDSRSSVRPSPLTCARSVAGSVVGSYVPAHIRRTVPPIESGDWHVGHQ